LDEADQLLAMGFRKHIEEIIAAVTPKENRQTLLFSATFPHNMEQLTRLALRRKFKMVDTIGGEENTHDHVQQCVMFCSMENLISELYFCVEKAMSISNYKVLVFFATANLTKVLAQIFNNMGISVLSTHSRLRQNKRNTASNLFRSNSSIVMFTSDLSSRGMDYPDVTEVIQVGIPQNVDGYTHRLGRTARAGKAGKGTLLLCDWERPFLTKLKPLQEITSMPAEERVQILPMIKQAVRLTPEADWALVYQGFLGFYSLKRHLLKFSLATLVSTANKWICRIGLRGCPPGLGKREATKMGLIGVKGLTIVDTKRKRNKKK